MASGRTRERQDVLQSHSERPQKQQQNGSKIGRNKVRPGTRAREWHGGSLGIRFDVGQMARLIHVLWITSMSNSEHADIETESRERGWTSDSCPSTPSNLLFTPSRSFSPSNHIIDNHAHPPHHHHHRPMYIHHLAHPSPPRSAPARLAADTASNSTGCICLREVPLRRLCW